MRSIIPTLWLIVRVASLCNYVIRYVNLCILTNYRVGMCVASGS